MSAVPILIVEDNAINSKLACAVLEAAGYETRVAANADEALAVLISYHPRLILMDLQLPGIDGFELTRRLKAAPATRDITIVALTAYAMTGDEAQALAAGCDGYIAKPINTRAFPGQVASYLRRGPLPTP
jgi:CheY-like chemotaxis protein